MCGKFTEFKKFSLKKYWFLAMENEWSIMFVQIMLFLRTLTIFIFISSFSFLFIYFFRFSFFTFVVVAALFCVGNINSNGTKHLFMKYKILYDLNASRAMYKKYKKCLFFVSKRSQNSKCSQS